MIKVLICGTGFTGNVDARAVTDTIIEQIKNEDPDARITLLCKYPKDDLPVCRELGYQGYSFTTVQQLFYSIPFYIIGKLFDLLGLDPAKLPMAEAIRAYFEHDVMVDTTGISFCDDCPFSSLVINVLWFLPAFISKIKTIKTAGSMGPFRKWYVKSGARFVLPKVDVLVARGDISYTLTKEFLPGKKIYNLPDIAFCLSPCSGQRRDDILRQHRLFGKKYVILGLSYVVDKLAGHDLYMDVYSEAVRWVRRFCEARLLLIPYSRAHSATLGVDSSSDDVHACRSLQIRLQAQGIESDVLDDILNAHELQGVIGGADFVIASRYHLLVASLSSGVPSMALGWSHKYEEMFQLFGLEEWVITHEKFSGQLVKEKTIDFCGSIQGIKNTLDERLSQAYAASQKNVKLICALIDQERSRG